MSICYKSWNSTPLLSEKGYVVTVILNLDVRNNKIQKDSGKDDSFELIRIGGKSFITSGNGWVGPDCSPGASRAGGAGGVASDP